MSPEPEPNEEIVNRIEAWLPGLEAPLNWVQTIDFPTPDESDESESSELRRSA